ncbi:hypothetical protein B0T25DRAFT_594906 [Lasiosphaeria hispida]|uniref:Uncharacterized protein n=1 Tax=Lasiosphaeria hispida TaxID=260671 RepID=A0AAJ0HT82_9PEZI|nr:hypothetical protein B0T25DRAFT_594906 [Lasiosphaeria hispida]
MHQAVPPNGYTITTTKRSADPSPLDRERREDSGAGLYPSDPIHVSSPPALETERVVAGLTLPELSGTVEEQLAALIEFGTSHWPQVEFCRFKRGVMITGAILEGLLRLDLNQSNYVLGVPPRRVAKITTKDGIDGIVNPFHVRGNHWVIAIIGKKRKTFTSYGMTTEEVDEYRGSYQEALQLGSLEAVSYDLEDYTGNTCAFRCCDAFAAYLGIRQAIIQDQLSLRLFYLQRLLQSLLLSGHPPPYMEELGVVTTVKNQPNEAENGPKEDEDEIGDDEVGDDEIGDDEVGDDEIGDYELDEDESSGAERGAGQPLSAITLDTPAQAHTLNADGHQPTAGAQPPNTATNARRTFELQSQSYLDEACSFGTNKPALLPSKTLFELDMAQQLRLLGQSPRDGCRTCHSPDTAALADTSPGSTPGVSQMMELDSP